MSERKIVDLLQRSFHKALLAITGQIFGRIISLLLYSFAIHYVPCKEALAIMNVKLLFLESIILLFSRDAMRQACQQSIIHHDWPKVINLIWMIVPICFLNCIIFGPIWIYFLEAPTTIELQKQYVIAVWLICISCLVECCSEVPNFLIKTFFFDKVRIAISMIYSLTRSLVFVTFMCIRTDVPIHAFSIANLAAGTIWAVSNYIFFAWYLPAPQELVEQNFTFETINDFFPSFKHWELPKDLRSLWMNFSLTVFVKQVLQDSEYYAMVFFGILPSTKKQATFDIIQSIGSIPMRLLLRPINETLYFYYAQRFKRGSLAKKLNKEECEESSSLMYNTFRTSLMIGLLINCVNAFYSAQVLELYTGEHPSQEEQLLLQMYGVLFILCAILTITESFSFAVMNANHIAKYNLLLTILAILQMMGIIMARVFEEFGIVATTCGIIAMRIIYCVCMVRYYYKGTSKQPLEGLIPSRKMLQNVACFLAVSSISQYCLCGSYDMLHLSVGLATFVISLITYVAFQEPEIVELFV